MKHPAPLAGASTALVLLAVVSWSASCSSGGGGGGGIDPRVSVLAASFLGAGSQPVAGDRLRLYLSEPVGLVGGALLDETDLTIVSGSLGAVAGAPTLVGSREVEVVLGAGVALVSGVTTIDASPTNDVIVDGKGALAVPGTARVLRKGDGDTPTISGMTLSGVDALLNGTGPAGGTLQVMNNGFQVDLAYTDASSSIEPGLTSLTASVNILVDGVSLAPHNELLPYLVATTAATTASYTVPPNVSFPQGAVTLTSHVADASGRVSVARTYSFLVRTRTNAIQLFETSAHPRQLWYLDTSRDVESFSVNLANASTPVVVGPAANGRSDVGDLLRVLGLHSPTPLPNVSGASDSNDVVTSLLENAVITQLGLLFPGVNVEYTFTSPGTFPAGDPFVPYNQFPFSQICIGGSAESAGTSGVLGLAIFDEHNSSQEDDCSVDFMGSRLGVFLHTMINSGFLSSPTSAFRMTFDPFTPARSGSAIGETTGDDGRLLGSVGDARETAIHDAIADLARFTAVVVAHECGHSMGLVKNGPMPGGLYGNETVAFPGSQSGHIVMPSSHFPGVSFNVMSPSISYVGALAAQTSFNSLNAAYLREIAVYD